MKQTLCALLLITLSINTQAGWFDSISNFFSGEKPATEEQSPSVTENTMNKKNNTALLKTGLALLPMLVDKLGISQSQAGGGLGALLSTAQSFMANDQFSSLAAAIPGANKLISSAPKPSSSNMMSKALSLAGDNSDQLKAGANLVSQFSSLGLETSMISQFTDITSDYLNQSDKAQEANALSSLISELL